MKDCTCPHTPKHHKQRGGCRKGCNCNAGLKKAQRKVKAK